MYKQSESEPNVSLSPEPEELANPPAQWTVDTLPRLEMESSKDVTLNHLLTALNHIVELLNAAGIEWAVMGGVAMFMHGFLDRNTRDVDMAVDAKPKEVIAALKSQRIYTPPLLSMAGSGCGRFYVLTGPKYGDVFSAHVVEVDCIMTGYLGTPQDLPNCIITQIVCSQWGRHEYNVLSIKELFRIKLHVLDVRDAERDLNDLRWILINYNKKVKEIADTLDEPERFNFVDKWRKKWNPDESIIKSLMATLNLETPHSSGNTESPEGH